MKKTTKRLSLSKETLHALEAGDDLRAAMGGYDKSGDGEFHTRCSDCAGNTWTCRPAI